MDLHEEFSPVSAQAEWIVTDSSVDLIHCILISVSNLSFVVWDLFVIWNLKFGI